MYFKYSYEQGEHVIFKKVYYVDRDDVAEALGKKNWSELVLTDFEKIIPESKHQVNSFENKTNFILITEEDECYKKTFIQRLNTLWVYPIMICTMPIKWLFTGNGRYSRHTKFGEIVCNLIGEKE